MRYRRLIAIVAVLAAAVSAVAAVSGAAMSPVVSAKMTGGGESPKGPAGASASRSST